MPFEGPTHLDLLATLHRTLKPALYVEFGTETGETIAVALPETQIVAVGEMPTVPPRPGMLLACASNNDFFAIVPNRRRVAGFDLAFMHGGKPFEEAAEDFLELVALAKASSIVCLAADDVLMSAIRAASIALVAFTVACPPSGLGIVRSICALPSRLSYPTVRDINLIANDPAAILAAFNGGSG